MTTITVQRPRPVAVPRAAAPAAWLFGWLTRCIDQLAQARQARSERRRQEGRLADAAALRRQAQQLMGMDARYAADLFAAADRHERGE